MAALEAMVDSLGRAGAWAGDVAQNFGAVLSDLMGPAVFCAYVIAFWSLANDLGWTNTFMFASGPLSNWLVWFGLAIVLSLAAGILRRHIQNDTRS